MSLISQFKSLSLLSEFSTLYPDFKIVRHLYKYVEKPLPGNGRCFRRIVHYPQEYTVKPLDVTNLAGRDPVSGRVVAKGIGGGIKHKFHWISKQRIGPLEGPPKEEKVIQIIEDGCRTSFVALVASGRELKYILATENMKAGDILRTSMHIPRIPVRAKEGDAYPLGALPLGTQINSVERYPGKGSCLVQGAGTFATIIRRTPDQRIIIQLPSKHEYSLSQQCMCTVGRLSNVDHNKTPIGSAQRSRELGNRPRSGWWQRKTGYHGKKIRPLPAVKVFNQPLPEGAKPLRMSLACEPVHIVGGL